MLCIICSIYVCVICNFCVDCKQMFVIVEFAENGERKVEISLVPLTWLHKNDIKSYWPNRIMGNLTFEQFVRNETPYKKTWVEYKVNKVRYKTVNYDMAEEKLSYLLQTNAKEVELSGGSITSWTKKVIDSPLNDDSESDVERESQVLLSQHTPKRLFHSNEEFLRLSRSSTASSVIGCAINTPSIDSVLSQHSRPVNIMSDFENSVLPSLLRINKTIKQHSIILQQLLRKSENSEFKNFDSSFENKEDLHQYMIRRLAAVVVIESVWLREGL